MLTHVSPGSLVSFEYGCHIGASFPDNVDPVDEYGGFISGFMTFVLGKARALVEDSIAKLSQALDDNDDAICVYRGLYVDRTWIDGDISQKPIGACWAWDYDFAIAHRGQCSGDDPIDVRLVGLVASADIDWTETTILSASDVYVTGEEREIRLRADASVEIAAVDWRPSAFGDGREGYKSASHLEASGIVVGATWSSPMFQASQPLAFT
jgi:hypothetical protein